MTIRGRVRAIPITVAFAAVSTGPLAAAPPLLSPDALQRQESWKLPEIHPAPPRNRAETVQGDGLEGSYATTAIRQGLEDPSGPVDRTPPSLDAPGTADGTTANGNQYSHGERTTAHTEKSVSWVAVLGEVARPGSYEVSGGSMTLAELMARCDGLATEAKCSISIVRNGRYWGAPQSAQEVLWPGDLVVITTPSAGEPSQDVRIGVVGLPGSPAAVMVPRAYATVDGVLRLSGQKHIHASDIKVLLGGTRETSGDRVVELTQGSVLVFDAQRLATNADLDLRALTHFYPAPKMPSGLAPSPVTQISLEAQEQHSAPMAVSTRDELSAFAHANSIAGSDLNVPLSETPSFTGFGTTDISALPSIEFIEPPAEIPHGHFPRTADASGAIPIGAPEAESHIVPMPIDAGGTIGVKQQKASDPKNSLSPPHVKVRPTPLEISAEETQESDHPSASDLAPTILIGSILGALTFFGIRYLRNRGLLTSIRLRLMSFVNQKQVASEITKTTAIAAPSDILASLIADRLAFREEQVQFPSAMRVYGRSPALRRRRVDPVAASLAGPHFGVPNKTPVRDQQVADQGPIATKLRGSNLRVDDAQGLKRSSQKSGAGTPFERALAALESRHQDGPR